MTTDRTMGTLDSMVMAGKGTHSEEPVPLVCPQCRGRHVDQTCKGILWGRDTNEARCRADGCGASGIVADWRLIEQLRRYVARIVLEHPFELVEADPQIYGDRPPMEALGEPKPLASQP